MLKHVDDTLARASCEIAQRLMPQGWDTLAHDAPDTFQKVCDYWFANRRIGVSAYMSPKRFFGTAEACRSFDAWHDYCHVQTQGLFNCEGEARVNDMQQAHLLAWYHHWADLRPTEEAIKRASAVLNMNNLGRLQHWKVWDHPPADTRSFAEGWLAALGMAEKPAPLFDLRNEWTQYLDREG